MRLFIDSATADEIRSKRLGVISGVHQPPLLLRKAGTFSRWSGRYAQL